MTHVWRPIAAARDRRIVGPGLEIAERPGPLFVWLKTTLRRDGPADACLRMADESGATYVRCGERKARWFQRRDGLRCHFQLILRDLGTGSRVLAYSFQVDHVESAAAGPRYLRYDFTEQPHADPVTEPWCHFTPGNEILRAPAPLLTPQELVGWFSTLEPW